MLVDRGWIRRIEANVKGKLATTWLALTIALCLGAGPASGLSLEEDVARELFRLSNEERAKEGQPALEWDDRLARAAHGHAEEMAKRDELSHQFPGEPPLRERIAATLLRFNRSAENVAFATNPGRIHQGWMDSAGHRKNILSPKYNALGVAVVRRDKYLYAVQDFAFRLEDRSNREVGELVAGELNRERAQRGQPQLAAADGATAERHACSMAEEDQMKAASIAGALAGAKSVFTFTASDPAVLPDGLARSVPAGASRVAIGACFARTPRYPEGTNWVVVAFY